MSIFDIFKPAPHIKEISDKKIISKKYLYWRIRIFYSMYIGYAFFYFTRKSYTFAMPKLLTDLGFDKADVGYLGTVLAFTYGASKFFSGIMSDRSNPRYFMSIGLILTGIFNICFGLSSSLILFAIFWGLNGWFQGWGWPPCAKLLTHWYSQKERGRWWSIWNTSHNLGGFLIPIICGFIAKYYGWRYAMYLPGILGIAIGLFLMNRLRDTPRSLGLPKIEKYKNDNAENENATKDKKEFIPLKKLLLEYIIKNKYIWFLSFASFFVYIVRTAMNDWSALYLIETKDMSIIKANFIVCFFEVGGFVGSLAAGFSSDYFFKGRRGPINTIFAFLILLFVFLFWQYAGMSEVLFGLITFCIGFFVFGPQMLVGIAAVELSHKKAAGTVTGIVSGIFAYLGAAVAGGPLGKITDVHGWNGFFITMVVCSIISILFLAFTWNAKSRASKI